MGTKLKDGMTDNVYENKQGSKFQVVEYLGANKVKVKFLDEHGHEMFTTKQAILDGGVKNPYLPNVQGVGYTGSGKYRTSGNRDNICMYNRWAGVIERTYGTEEYYEKHPTYRYCTLHEPWLCYQEFADWCFTNQWYNRTYHLDKDLLVSGNKHYSPETCVLIPLELNNFFNSPEYVGDAGLPTGVKWHSDERYPFYEVHLSKFGKKTYVGIYRYLEDAIFNYELAKRRHAYDVMRPFVGLVDDRIEKKFMDYAFGRPDEDLLKGIKK